VTRRISEIIAEGWAAAAVKTTAVHDTVKKGMPKSYRQTEMSTSSISQRINTRCCQEKSTCHFCSEACKARFDASPEKHFNARQDLARHESKPGPGGVAAGLKKVEFPVSGMSCASCVARIEKGLSKMNGIANVKVNFASEKAFVTFDPTQVHLGDLMATVKDLGYAAGMEKVTLPVHGMSCCSCFFRHPFSSGWGGGSMSAHGRAPNTNRRI
jgi:copper ion binding protein